jgi:GDP-L-fucose synthase
MKKESRIYIAGHRGMVGSSVVRCLRANGYFNLILRTSEELDLTRQADVERFFGEEKPDYVFLAAARVGGIMANNTFRADFIFTNLQIQTNVIRNAWKTGVKKLLFFSSSCVYPRSCPQPMKEEYLLSGPLEITNTPYAVAKIAGMTMCQAYNDQYRTNFISAIPTNLYGPNDNFDPMQSHLMAALILKFHAAKEHGASTVTLWGSGSPRRELMHVDDAADAALFLMRNYDGAEPVNVGTGEDIPIRELAEIVRRVVEYDGKVEYDPGMPDGAPAKRLDIRRIESMNWTPKISLLEGIVATYRWYLESLRPVAAARTTS